MNFSLCKFDSIQCIKGQFDAKSCQVVISHKAGEFTGDYFLPFLHLRV